MHRLLRWSVLTCVVMALSACHALVAGRVPAVEFDEFQAMPMAKRAMNEVRVRWDIRDDVVTYCARASGMGREQAMNTPPLACAIWSVDHKECTIVTARNTTHLALGHELRHCFEGHFHK